MNPVLKGNITKLDPNSKGETEKVHIDLDKDGKADVTLVIEKPDKPPAGSEWLTVGLAVEACYESEEHPQHKTLTYYVTEWKVLGDNKSVGIIDGPVVIDRGTDHEAGDVANPTTTNGRAAA